ncbi:hypothetical protein FACS1894199_06440 [Bacteroidia bacterium]|nr:hypothetical protein FACS1894199_06440 [Bacteroidia bacterium]
MKKLLLVICVGCILGSCTEMNDKHESYFKDGEIIYIGRVDSLKLFPGNERLLLQYQVSDPRAKNLNISWLQGKESLELPVPVHQPDETFERYIGKNDKTIAEGSYTFKFVVGDEKEHKSVVVESNVNVYGQKYQSRLTNRPLISAEEAIGNNVTLQWAGATSNDEFGIKLRYTNTAGDVITERYKSDEIISPMTIPDVKLTDSMTYQTLYLPEPTAIDTFFTVPQKVSIRSLPIIVSRGKTVTWSDANNASSYGSNAVDGIPTNASRWVGDGLNNEHWIEIDLGGTHSINAFQTWREVVGDKSFRLQVNDGGTWVDVVVEDNSLAAGLPTIYYREFTSVSTDKVRYLIPQYNPVADNRPRLWEIEIYSVTYY